MEFLKYLKLNVFEIFYDKTHEKKGYKARS